MCPPLETSREEDAYHAQSAAAWRAWLEANHRTKSFVWLIIYRKQSGVPSVYYSEAVDEALCFGWIDSAPRKRDERSYYLYFSPRKPRSKWSGVNKAKVENLLKAGKMADAGLRMVQLAKETGTWEALAEVDALTEPEDLAGALNAHPESRKNWNAFAPSARRGILEWIQNAKQPATRQKRIAETARLAALNLRANFPESKGR